MIIPESLLVDDILLVAIAALTSGPELELGQDDVDFCIQCASADTIILSCNVDLIVRSVVQEKVESLGALLDLRGACAAPGRHTWVRRGCR